MDIGPLKTALTSVNCVTYSDLLFYQRGGYVEKFLEGLYME
jgi:hypothetical protein